MKGVGKKSVSSIASGDAWNWPGRAGSCPGAAAMGWVLAEYVFKFPWKFEPQVWLAGVVVGAICALVGGWLGLRSVLRQPPLQTLREA